MPQTRLLSEVMIIPVPRTEDNEDVTPDQIMSVWDRFVIKTVAENPGDPDVRILKGVLRSVYEGLTAGKE